MSCASLLEVRVRLYRNQHKICIVRRKIKFVFEKKSCAEVFATDLLLVKSRSETSSTHPSLLSFLTKEKQSSVNFALQSVNSNPQRWVSKMKEESRSGD